MNTLTTEQEKELTGLIDRLENFVESIIKDEKLSSNESYFDKRAARLELINYVKVLNQ